LWRRYATVPSISNHHEDFSMKWLITFLVAAASGICAAFVFLHFYPPAEDAPSPRVDIASTAGIKQPQQNATMPKAVPAAAEAHTDSPQQPAPQPELLNPPVTVAAPPAVNVALAAVHSPPTAISPAVLAMAPVQSDVKLTEKLLIPVAGIKAGQLRDTFDQARGPERRHQAIDIMAPTGTKVFAVADGKVVKLFDSKQGGLTAYQFDATENFAYYYAHLDQYAPGISEGSVLKRGDLIGYVGYTGNAVSTAPHLHFAISVLGPEKQWWKGTPINPYPLFQK
jgi:murein DD-endopeptidase MepM/ murein hydrolase activator NlpD